MWRIYLDSETWGGRPSQRLNVPPLQNDWAAYQFDQAVLFVGMTIKNALLERVPTGDPKNHQTRPKYTLARILEPDFRLDLPPEQKHGGVFEAFIERLKASAGQPGAGGRVWVYVPPEPEKPA